MSDPPDRRFWWWAGAITCAALVGRVAWVGYAAHHPQGLYDPARYLGAAQLIAKGKGYVEPLTGKPTAYYPPGYPWFLGMVAWVAHHNPLVRDPTHLAGYVQAVLGATTVGSVAVIGRRIASARAGLVAAVIVALYPNLVFHTAALLSETLCIALLAAGLAALCWTPRGAPLARWQVAAFAVTFALGVMVRPISFPVVAVVGIWWWFETHDRRQALVVAGTALGASVLVIGVWTVRNEVRMHAFVPLSTNTGDNLCIGHGPHATGGFLLEPRCEEGPSVLQGPAGELAHDRAARAEAWREVRQAWTREPWLTWRRLDIMFEQDHDGLDGVTSFHTQHWMPASTYRDLARLADDFGAIVLGLGIVGSLLLVGRRRADGGAVVATAVVLLAVPLLFFGDPRFKVPAMPFVAVAAAIAIDVAISQGTSFRRRRTPVAS